MIYLTGDTHGEIDIRKLSANKNVGQVLVVTHEAPNSIHDLAIGTYGIKKHDKLTCYLESLLQDLQFDKWYFGHYHRTDTFGDKSQFRLLYDDVVKAGETEPILSGEEQERRRKVVEEMGKRLKKLKEEGLM